jgi:peroxiredoxin Q/BCP
MPTTAKKVQTTLSVGDKAPNFHMPADDGSNVSLVDYVGKQHLVLYFYPRDDTPGCTIEAKEFRDNQKAFAKLGAAIIGVSKDDIKSHCKFRDKFDLSFLLASDAESDVCERYGVWVEKNMYGKKYMGISRETFLISKAGSIAAHWPKVKPEGHAAEVLEALKAL